jgi:hypothetical protein
MPNEYKPDLLPEDEILAHKALDEVFKKDSRDYYHLSPCAALGFWQRLDPVLSFSEANVVNLASDSGVSKISFWEDTRKNLEAEVDRLKGENDMGRFRLRYVSFPNLTRKYHIPAVFLATFGLAPDCIYADSGMYSVDDMGVDVILAGLRAKINPCWCAANYPLFARPEVLREPRLNNPALNSFVEYVRARQEPVCAGVK